MRLWGLLGGKKALGIEELARRLGTAPDALRNVRIAYREFVIPKRSGGTRPISAPDPELMQVQRLIHRRLLLRLKTHPAATGFQRNHSIVTNAAFHAGRAVVLSMDIKDFFGRTSSDRIRKYFRFAGWNKETANLLTDLCTYRGGLPQGAPTSPRLSNLVNCRLDARITALAERRGARYTRYADDLTFSFESDDSDAIHELIRAVKLVLQDEGYEIHHRRKLRIRRRHQRQFVTGLVVNEQPALPRTTRRKLRAIEHAAAQGRECSLSKEQLNGWRALQHMIDVQRTGVQ